MQEQGIQVLEQNRSSPVVYAADCSSRVLLDQIADKWSVLILATLCKSPLRFNEIKRRLDGITQKALTQSLRRLERNGILSRRVIPSSQVAVEYSVTDLGHTLEEPFRALYRWTLQYSDAVKNAQEAFDKRAEEQ
ncbi:MarR family transcriptional regulator [Pseudomonas sp. 2822-15]|uniref:winged helix-turn-helix transcriptional regulator n=1 Tax=Pseudomonas sp. 2822-15 TaxID=1712677 RepID=UPI000C14B74E|nr:helix-turn-helix domain-containing protein [Pseudomonas sp. 2822-15]PIB44486.1 MarR family transcriptional regulator [Pseudomonas sp. 2822-15]